MLRRRLFFLFMVLLFAMLAFAVLNWSNGALPGANRLPPGFEDWAAPTVSMNAAVYVVPQRPSTVIIRRADGTRGDLRVVRFEGVALDPLNEFAARAEFVDASETSVAARALEEDIWRVESGRKLWYGKPDAEWARAVRAMWGGGDLVSWSEHEPAAWWGWRLLPDEAPSPLLALGFVRNRGGLVDRTLRELGVEADGLGSALQLARMNLASFGLYGQFDDAPPEVNSDVLRGTGAGLIAVSESTYPSFVVGALWGRVASAARLKAISVGGEEAHYRDLGDGWHMTVKRYGRTLYFVVAPSRSEAEALMLAVIESQRSRQEQ